MSKSQHCGVNVGDIFSLVDIVRKASSHTILQQRRNTLKSTACVSGKDCFNIIHIEQHKQMLEENNLF